MNTLFRAADLAGRGSLPAGRIDLGFLTGLDGFDDEISLIRTYHGHAVKIREEDYNAYPGGPGFTVLHRAAFRRGVTMRQAARWWATYRMHPEVVIYRALFTVQTNTIAGWTHLCRLLKISGIPFGAEMDTALGAVMDRGLVHDGPGRRLTVTSAGKAVLHATKHPSRLGEDDPDLFKGDRS